MMLALVAALSIGTFTVSLFLSGLVRTGHEALSTAHDAVGVMRDKTLSDEEREPLVQKASLQLCVAFFSIALRFALALGLAFLPIWIFELGGIVTIEETLAYLSRWHVIVISTIIISIGLVLWHRLKTSH